jgi:hypothetical protein
MTNATVVEETDESPLDFVAFVSVKGWVNGTL